MAGNIFRSERRRLRRAALIASLSLVTLVVTWLWAHEGHAPLASKGAQIDPENPNRLILTHEGRDALDVQTEVVGFQPVEENVLAYATLVAPWNKHAFVTTRIPGRVDKVHVKPGDKVAAGQLLAEVESPELKNVPLELLTAQNNLELSRKTMKDLEPLVKEGAVREQRILEAQAKHQQDVNALDIARSKWLSLGLSPTSLEKFLEKRDPNFLGAYPVVSPIAGVISHADIPAGRVVAPTEHLFEIVDLSSVWLKIGVLEKDLNKIVVGQTVELSLAAFPNETLPAQVQVKGLYLDPATHVGTAWAELSNPPAQAPRLLPGMHGQAQIVVSRRAKALAVPAQALITDGAESYVIVEEGPTAKGTQYLKKAVVVGQQSAGYVEIRGGGVYLKDRVVTRGSHEMAGMFIQGVLRLTPEAMKNIGLRVEPVGRQVVEEVIELDGAVDLPPGRRTVASSQLAGTIQGILIDRDQPVKAKQVLAEVASLELQNLQLKLLQAHLDSQVLAESLKRMRAVAASLPPRQLWETESQYNIALFQRESLKQKLSAVGLEAKQIEALLADKKLVETLPLRALSDGVVVHFDKALGQAIKAEEPIFEIHDLSSVWVQGYLAERDFRRVRIKQPGPESREQDGQPVRVRLVADPAFLAEGKVRRSGHVFGEDSRTLSLWIELNDAPKVSLQHNMLARITVTVAKPTATLAVPVAAVVHEGMRPFVFVRKPDGLFHRQAVTTGRADDRYVEILSGLQAGELVAVQGAAELKTAYASLR